MSMYIGEALSGEGNEIAHIDLLIGDKDEFQREAAELLAARIPGARIVRIAGGGHLLNLTSPAEFQSAVAAFLAKHP